MKKILQILKTGALAGLTAMAFYTGDLIAAPVGANNQMANSTGIGEAATSILDSYSPDLLMDDLMNSPFLTEADRQQLEKMSPEEQAELFSSVVDIFNDPEFQAVLNDPKFLEEMSRVNEMIESGEFDFGAEDWSDLDIPSMPEEKPKETPKPITPTAPRKPTKAECQNMASILKAILDHLYLLETKAALYEDLNKYFTAYSTKITELKFYVEVLQKEKNLEYLASEEYSPLSRALCSFKETLETYEPEILMEQPAPDGIYDPYQILGVSRLASHKDIEKKFEVLSKEKKPARILERLKTEGADEQKIAKRMKKAELHFAPIKKAYEDLMDEEYREEIDRILKAELVKEKNVKSAVRESIWKTISALEEAFFTPGTILSRAASLIKQHDADAAKLLEERLEQEKIAGKKLEEWQKKPARPSPVPAAPAEDFNYPYFGDYYGYPGGYNYGRPQDKIGTPQPPAGGPSAEAPSAKPGDKKKEADKKKDEKKEDKKKEDKDKKKEGDKKKDEDKKKEDEKKELDPLIKAIQELDQLLNEIERGKKPEEPKKPAAPAKDKEEGEKKEEKKEPPKASDEDKEKFAEELDGFMKKFEDPTFTEKEAEELIKKIGDRLKLEEIDVKTKIIELEAKKLEKKFEADLAKVPDQIKDQVRAAHKKIEADHLKAFGGMVKSHKLLLEKLKALRQLDFEKVQNQDVQKRFFKVITRATGAATEPTDITLVKLQKRAAKFLDGLAKTELEINPEAKKKAEEEAEAKKKAAEAAGA